MADHPNVELFQRGYTAFQTGDLETVASLFAPDIVWHIGGHNHHTGDHTGIENVLALFAANFAETNGTFKTEVHDIVANDTHGVALATISGEKDGKKLDDHYTHVAHFVDGKLTESWIFQEDQAAVDDFWG